MSLHPTRECVVCARTMFIAGKGMCGSCYVKAWRASKPDAETWRTEQEPSARTGWRAPVAVDLRYSGLGDALPPKAEDLSMLARIYWLSEDGRKERMVGDTPRQTRYATCEACPHTSRSHSGTTCLVEDCMCSARAIA